MRELRRRTVPSKMFRISKDIKSLEATVPWCRHISSENVAIQGLWGDNIEIGNHKERAEEWLRVWWVGDKHVGTTHSDLEGIDESPQ